MSRPAQEETFPVHPSRSTEREGHMDSGLQNLQERPGSQKRQERQKRQAREEGQGRASGKGQRAALRRLASAYPVTALFAVWYSVGFLLMVFSEVPKPLEFSNGVFLVLYALCLCELAATGIGAVPKHRDEALSRPVGWSRLALSAAGIAAGTFAVEYAGVHTGFPFGTYRYENTLGSLLGGVPWTMGLAWVGVILNGALLSGSRGRLVRALETGAWVVLLDLVLDPVAEARGVLALAGRRSLLRHPGRQFCRLVRRRGAPVPAAAFRQCACFSPFCRAAGHAGNAAAVRAARGQGRHDACISAVAVGHGGRRREGPL
ncbi:hypothetical protein BN871_BK_00080 [Paenibacillus sp. P22]|nr:carotenoid biosynthesis protein [Paenibacillus sp. P22]CDN42485.1 hypothetical protein BN871_BK_00080 [Paenibacillus sp. P22]